MLELRLIHVSKSIPWTKKITNTIIGTWPADGVAPMGARIYEDTVVTKSGHVKNVRVPRKWLAL